ncbi:D-alanine--D-alanine ligase [Streptomyces sp. NBC_00853]|uniref:D-alanine--D-alanine ligase family protein n=1 Tax=unclassified Streptomyces TaxID=2593676 RepID=UPI002E0FADA1|nr:D-alanine--D-alanine ligase [Streptomyces sp. NBC_01233]WTA20918.1 D-alanine--D-alanine ligase [Streptomyces sp. NBC_00853]
MSDQPHYLGRIGVLYGGDSPERPGSVASAEAVFKALANVGMQAEMIDLADVRELGAGLRDRIDVALLACHGPGGEDGKVQGHLEQLGIPYTGSGVLASALGMHKPTFKTLLAALNIDTPKSISVLPEHSVESTLTTVELNLGYPVFVKPAGGGGSLGAGIARTAEELAELLRARRDQPYAEYMVEEYIDGIPCTVGILDQGGPVVLPLLTCETDRAFYDYEAKHDRGLRRETCPATLPEEVEQRVMETALRVHRLIGAHGVSRVDFLICPDGRSPVLEVNTVPGLSEHGNLATMAAAAGVSYVELIKRVLDTAFTKVSYVP